MSLIKSFVRWATAPRASTTQPGPSPRFNDTDYFSTNIDRLRDDALASTSAVELKAYADHRSGYVREAAIRRCAELALPEALSIIGAHLNDWVAVVRDAARTAVLSLLERAPASARLALLPFVARLRFAGRTDHSTWVALFEARLIACVPVQQFSDGVRAGDVAVARACFALLKTHALIDPAALLRLGLAKRGDIVIALEAVRLCAAEPPASQEASYRRALQSHFGIVRTIALRALLALEAASEKPATAIDALLDPQSSVRAVAMSYLRTTGFDLRAHYRQQLEHGVPGVKLMHTSLISLASLGCVDDKEFVKRFILWRTASVRLSAYTAWSKLDMQDKDSIAELALGDDGHRVRRFAWQLVRRHGAYVPFAYARKTLLARGDHRLMLQFSTLSKWDWLIAIADSATSGGPGAMHADQLSDEIRCWIHSVNSYYERPNAEHVRALSAPEIISTLRGLVGGDERLTLILEHELAQGQG